MTRTAQDFRHDETHWFRIAGGQVPPTPWYLLRMALAKRRARR